MESWNSILCNFPAYGVHPDAPRIAETLRNRPAYEHWFMAGYCIQLRLSPNNTQTQIAWTPPRTTPDSPFSFSSEDLSNPRPVSTHRRFPSIPQDLPQTSSSNRKAQNILSGEENPLRPIGVDATQQQTAVHAPSMLPWQKDLVGAGTNPQPSHLRFPDR